MPRAKKVKGSTAFGYARVSTSRQEMSIEVQKLQVYEYYKWKLGHGDVSWGECYVDPAVSGGLPFRERAAGYALCDRVGPGDHIVVAKLDRAFRNARDAMNCLDSWMKRNIHVHLIDIGADTTTPFGTMMIQLMAVFAEWERARMIERQKDVHALKRARGEPHPGTDPLGFFLKRKKNGVHYLEDNPAELAAMKRAYELQMNGESLERIAAKFNELKVKRFRRKVGINHRPADKPWGVVPVWNLIRAYKLLLGSNKLPEYARPEASASRPPDATTSSGVTPSPATDQEGPNCSTSPTPEAPPP